MKRFLEHNRLQFHARSLVIIVFSGTGRSFAEFGPFNRSQEHVLDYFCIDVQMLRALAVLEPRNSLQ